jgi:hypothetical protein
MSPEIDLLNTYQVCGQERTGTLYHVEIVKDWQGRVRGWRRILRHVIPRMFDALLSR